MIPFDDVVQVTWYGARDDPYRFVRDVYEVRDGVLHIRRTIMPRAAAKYVMCEVQFGPSEGT